MAPRQTLSHFWLAVARGRTDYRRSIGDAVPPPEFAVAKRRRPPRNIVDAAARAPSDGVCGLTELMLRAIASLCASVEGGWGIAEPRGVLAP